MTPIRYMAVLPWTIFGRRVHPFSLAVCIALTTIFLYLGIWGEDATNFVFSNEWQSRAVGWVAGIGAAILIAGYVLDSDKCLRAGLLVGVFVFMSRFALYLMEVGLDSFPMWISLALAVGSGGAWLIERSHPDCPECRERRE